MTLKLLQHSLSTNRTKQYTLHTKTLSWKSSRTHFVTMKYLDSLASPVYFISSNSICSFSFSSFRRVICFSLSFWRASKCLVVSSWPSNRRTTSCQAEHVPHHTQRIEDNPAFKNHLKALSDGDRQILMCNLFYHSYTCRTCILKTLVI